MDTIEIGKVLKPQGVKGEIKIEPFINDVDYYKTIKYFIIDGREYKIKSASARQGYVYAMVDGIDNPNHVDPLRNKILVVKREDAPKLDYNEFFITDMIGVSVYDEDGTCYGEIIDIDQFGAADVYTISGRRGVHTFPFVSDMVISVDLSKKTLLVKKDRLKEVMVW